MRYRMNCRWVLLWFLLLLGSAAAHAQAPLTRLQIGGHSSYINQIAVSKDGTYLVSASDDATVKLWRCADNSLVTTFVPRAIQHRSPIRATSVAITGDNSLVIAGDGFGVMWVWRTSDFQLVRKSTIFDPTYNLSQGITALDCASDGSIVAVAGVDAISGNCIKIIRLSDGKKIRTLTGHAAVINRVAFALNKPTALASSAYDNSVRVWDASTGATKLNVTSAFSHDGTNSYLLWGGVPGANCVAMSADGAYVAASGEEGGNPNHPFFYGTVKVWSATTSTPTLKMKATTSNISPTAVTALAFSRDRTKIAAGFAGSYNSIPGGRFTGLSALAEYQVSTGSQIATYRSHDNAVLTIAYAANGASFYSAGCDCQIRQYFPGATDFNYVTQLYGSVYASAGSPDGASIAVAHIAQQYSAAYSYLYWGGGAGNVVDVRSSVDGSKLQSFYGATGPLAFSPDSALLACGSYYTTPWDIVTGQTYNDWTFVIDLSQSGTVILGAQGAAQRLWFDPDPFSGVLYAASYQITATNVEDGSLLNSYQHPAVGAWGYVNSPEGAFSALYDTSTNQFAILRMSDMSIVKMVSARPGDSGVGGRLALSPNAAYLAYTYGGNRNNVRIMRVSDGRSMGNITYSSDKAINLMTFSPQGDTLALYYDATGTDPTVVMVQLNGRKIGQWNQQMGTGLASMNFTPSGDEVMLGRHDGVLLACAKMNLASVKTLSLDRSTATGGVENRVATVALTGVAPSGGALVLLSSGDTNIATVPDSVVVPAGSKSITFNVTTKPVTSPVAVSLYAFCGTSAQTSLTVNPAIAIKGINISPSLLQGGMSASGVVSLKSPAYAGGVLVALTSSAPGVVSAPATVLIPEGKRLASFPIATSPTSTDVSATITGTVSGTSASANLLVANGVITKFEIYPPIIQGGFESTIGTVTLAAPCNTSVTVNITATTTSTAGLVTFPATVTIPAGASQGLFLIDAPFTVTSNQIVTFQVATTATTKTADLTLTP